jgi:hypothetical protein
VQEIAAATGAPLGGGASSHPLRSGVDVAPVLRSLLAAGAVSATAAPDVIPALCAAAAARPAKATGKERRGFSPVTALELLCDALLYVADVPEATLARLFSFFLRGLPQPDLAALWQRASAGATAALTAAAVSAADGSSSSRSRGSAKSGASASSATSSSSLVSRLEAADGGALGLVHLTGLLVRAPRNDVFMEAALGALPPDDVVALLACLRRLLAFHEAYTPAAAGARDALGAAELATAASAAAGAAAPAATAAAGPVSACLLPVLPSYGQVLDWVRMAIDAHFARVVLLVKGEPRGPLAALLRDLVAAVDGAVALCDGVAALKGAVGHVAARRPLPRPPRPSYAVEHLAL